MRGVISRTDTPTWHVLLDVDALGKRENSEWVFAGADLCYPDYKRALLSLSPDGGDAVVIREFDVDKREFVAGGFERPEAKGGMNWIDRDHVFIYTDFGAGSMTSSGYPRIAKRWQRGTPLADAATVYEGALLEAPLKAMRSELVKAASDAEGRAAVSYLDALLGLIDRAVENDDAKVLGRRKRSLVHLHLEFDASGEFTGHLHLGPLLTSALRRFQTCDAAIQPVLEQLGLPVSVGRTSYTVPDRTRVLVENRDGGCRVPGCTATRVEVHHIIHWEDLGPTDTWNLVCLCKRHHRLHHLGNLGISGNADVEGGLHITDQWGRTIAGSAGCDPPDAPPGEAATQHPLPWAPYVHGSGETFQSRNLWFGPPVAKAA